jgi:hypothetical protein
MKEYITDIEKILDSMIMEGKTAEDIDSIKIPDKYKGWLFDRFFKYNLNAGLDKKGS